MPKHDFQPMLAKPAKAIPRGDWFMEPKWDGWRAIAGRHHKGAWFEAARSGTRLKQLPYLETLLHREFERDTVLDGELVSIERGFNHVQKVLQTQRAHVPSSDSPPLQFVVFDVLVSEGDDVRGWRLRDRRDLLEEIFRDVGESSIMLCVGGPATEAFHTRALELGFEGTMVKSLTSQYRSGVKSPNWRKLKPQSTADVIVTGFSEPTAGSHLDAENLIGAIEFGYYDPKTDTIVPVSRCSGMTDRVRRHMSQNQGRWTGQVIEVAHLGVNESGKLRNPVFKRLRTDKPVEKCVAP